MKRVLAISLLFIPLLLSGCTEEGPVASSSGPETESSSSEISSSGEIDDVDYSIVTESEYGFLTLPKERYDFATIKENDNYPPAAEVEIACDWNYVTFLNENYTKILIENEAAVPSSAVSYSTRDSLSGTGGSSEIEAIVLTIDRSLIQPGTTRIRFETRPGNGVSTTKVFTVCFEVKVYPYGGIEVPTYDVNLKVDLSWLNDLMPEIEGATALTFTLSDSEEILRLFGRRALKRRPSARRLLWVPGVRRHQMGGRPRLRSLAFHRQRGFQRPPLVPDQGSLPFPRLRHHRQSDRGLDDRGRRRLHDRGRPLRRGLRERGKGRRGARRPFHFPSLS